MPNSTPIACNLDQLELPERRAELADLGKALTAVEAEGVHARLRFPSEFAGRGDMSRGGLLLRSVEDARELAYVGLAAGPRHGARPERLTPKPGILNRAVRRG